MLFFLCSFASSLLFATIPVFFSRILCVVVFLLISKWICEIAKKTPRNEKHVDNGILYSLLNVFISCHCFFSSLFLVLMQSILCLYKMFTSNTFRLVFSNHFHIHIYYIHLYSLIPYTLAKCMLHHGFFLNIQMKLLRSIRCIGFVLNIQFRY